MKTKIDLAYEKMNKNEIKAAEIIKALCENPLIQHENMGIIDSNGYENQMIFWLHSNLDGNDIHYVVLVDSVVHNLSDVNTIGHETIWSKLLLKTTNEKRAADKYYKWERKGNSVSIDEMENAAEIKKAYKDIIAVKNRTRNVKKRIELLKSIGYRVREETWFDTKRCDCRFLACYRIGNIEHKKETHTLDNGEMLEVNLYRSPNISLLNPFMKDK